MLVETLDDCGNWRSGCTLVAGTTTTRFESRHLDFPGLPMKTRGNPLENHGKTKGKWDLPSGKLT